MNSTADIEWIENVTYDELSVGQSARLIRTLTEADIQAFAAVGAIFRSVPLMVNKSLPGPITVRDLLNTMT